MRCNFDLQDLRRVLLEEHWLTSEEEMPHIGNRPDWGYMNHYEWDGKQYVSRKRTEGAELADQPLQWDDELGPEEWRRILLDCLKNCNDAPLDEDDQMLQRELDRDMSAAFCDGISTGFYINSYTTKYCPTMDGVLEEMRKPLDRLHQACTE